MKIKKNESCEVGKLLKTCTRGTRYLQAWTNIMYSVKNEYTRYRTTTGLRVLLACLDWSNKNFAGPGFFIFGDFRWGVEEKRWSNMARQQ